MILTDSTPTMSADEREAQNYEAILRPIYAELISQISSYQYFSFVGGRPNHRGMDIYHLGDRSNKNGYIIPDILDAIIIEGMELQIHSNDGCLGSLVSCVPQHEVQLYEAFHNVLFTNNVDNIIVGLLEVDFTMFDPDVQSIYTLTDGRGATFTVEELSPSEMDISTHADGVYIGSISSTTGTFIEFEYRVRNGECQSIAFCLIDTTFQTLDCDYAFNYPLNITSYGYTTGIVTIDSMNINIEGGTVIHDDTFTPTVTTFTDIFDTTITTLINSYYVNIVTSNGNTLTNKIIINLKNI